MINKDNSSTSDSGQVRNCSVRIQPLSLGETITINGQSIPRIYGGFGDGQPCIMAKQIAELHGRELFKINQLINDNLDWFEVGIDIIDLRSVILQKYNEPIVQFLLNFYSQNALNRSNYIYILSRQGYALLCKLLQSDLAKHIYKQMVRRYFVMEQETMPSPLLPPGISDSVREALKIARAFGLRGNQAKLSANRLVKELSGFDFLSLMGQNALICEKQEMHLTATEIGKMLGGISAQSVNKKLAEIGIIESYKDGKNRTKWKPTEKGKVHIVLKDTGKKHSDGTPVQQLFYLESVIGLLTAEQDAIR